MGLEMNEYIWLYVFVYKTFWSIHIEEKQIGTYQLWSSGIASNIE